ncbi:MAG: CoA transferase [Phototrophicaceae bacterium]
MTSPLANLKILDFSTLLPGPYATMMLADLGADIIRVEAPNRVDLVRMMPPFDGGVSGQHAVLNRSKRNLSLDLKHPESVEIIKELVKDYDIVIEQFRPTVMDRLGVGYETLREVNPNLIFCSLTGYGQSGEYKDRAGHDINYLALSGLLSYTGRKGETPPPLPMQVADIGAGSLHLVIGLLSAVIRRMTTGEGARVDISMLDGSLAWNAVGASQVLLGASSPAPEETLLNGASFYDLYQTKDERLLSVGSLEPKFWQGFCQAIEKPNLIEVGLTPDLAKHQEIKPIIRQTIASKTLKEWEAIFAEWDVCVEPVLTTEGALQHPQINSRGMLVQVPKPDGTEQQQVASPIHISDHSPKYRWIGTDKGAHTQEILTSLGYSDEQIQDLAQREIIKVT